MMAHKSGLKLVQILRFEMTSGRSIPIPIPIPISILIAIQSKFELLLTQGTC